MRITNKISWVRLFNRVFGFIFMLCETIFICMLNRIISFLCSLLLCYLVRNLLYDNVATLGSKFNSSRNKLKFYCHFICKEKCISCNVASPPESKLTSVYFCIQWGIHKQSKFQTAENEKLVSNSIIFLYAANWLSEIWKRIEFTKLKTRVGIIIIT